VTKHPRRIIVRQVAREPVLWIIDSEQWPRACLRAELIERGYNPYGFMTISDALEALTAGMSPNPQAIVLELRGQNLTDSVIESIRALKIPTIILAGNPEINDPLIAKHQWDMLLKRPFSLGTIADVIQRVVPANCGNAEHT
jgi:hypothetical protein